MKFHFAIVAALLTLSLPQYSFAGAPSSTVDPARDRIGQIVYPLGVHPPKDTGKTKGVAAKYPKAQDTGRNKDKSGD